MFSILILLISIIALSVSFDPYKTLGVSRFASQAEIRKAYHLLAKDW